MDGISVIAAVSAGLNTIILGAVILQNYRIGKIEGTLNNGGYLRCPFYRGKVKADVNCDTKKKG